MLYSSCQNHTQYQAERSKLQALTKENESPDNYFNSVDHSCNHCNFLYFSSMVTEEYFNSCCHNCLISLPNSTINDSLKELFLISPNLDQCIKKYKSAVAFALFSTMQKDIPVKGTVGLKQKAKLTIFVILKVCLEKKDQRSRHSLPVLY